MRELFKDQDYKATPFELEDAVLNGKTAEEVAEYVDPRYVTEAEAIAAFEAENGYRPSPEEVQDRIGQAEYTDATDAAGQEAYVNRTANHEQAELDDLKTYVDQRQITVDEVKDYAAQNGLTISDEEAKKLARQGSLEEILDEGQKIFDDFDERFVTRAELEGIARAEGYDPASLTEEDYAEFSGETSQSDAVKAIDTRATTEEELIEVFEQRTGIALDPYNPEDREKLTDMMEAATAANGGVVPSDAEFKAWTKKNIEYDLGVQVERLATGVRNAIFGTGPGGRPKTLQEILDELLGPPGTPGFVGKSPLVIKSTPGGAIGSSSTGVFGSPNVQVEIKFPVPLPVNGPPIIVPLYEEGVYVGPSSAGELLVGEDGVITQVKDNVTTTVGRISGQVVQVVGAAGEVVKAIPLGALDNPNWREGDPNPNDLVLDESGSPALIDENGNPLDKETGLPVYEAPDDADADNTFDLEDQDGDGIPDAIDPEVTVGNGEDPETKSPYDSGEASDAFRNSSWPDPDPDAQDTYSRQIEQMFLDYGLDTNQWPEGEKLNITGPNGQPVDANEDGVYTVEELAAVGITRAAGYDPRMFLGNDARLVLDTLEDTLDGLGLDIDDIETILGRIETDLQNVTTAEDLETFRTNLINELLDPETGLPSMGIDADELGDALDPITKAVDDLGTAIAGVAKDVTNLGETLNDRIDALVDQGMDRAEAVDLALADLADQLNTSTADILEQLGTTEAKLAEDIEAVAKDVTNLGETLNDRIDALVDQGMDRAEAVDLALADLADQLNTSTADILEQLGTTEAKLAEDIEAVAKDVTNLGETLNDRIDALVDQGMDRAEAVDLALADLADQLNISTADILEQLGTTEAKLAEDIEAVAKDVTNLGETLNDRIDALVDQGMDRAEAVDLALADLADQLNISTADILEQLGTTEANLAADIEAVAEDVTNLGETLNDRIDALVDQGLSRAEAVDQALADLSDQLGTSTADILEQLGTTEANLAADIEAVAGDVEAVAGDLSELADIVNGYIAQGLTNDEALAQAISDLSDKLGVTEDTLLTSLGETEETILGAIEDVNAQIAATNVSILDLNELVTQYELDGKTRDEAIQLAISDLSTDLGITKEEILTSIGETEETILGAIEGVNAQIDATNVNIDNLTALIVQYELDGKTRDEALSLALNDLSTDLGITKEEILTSIGETEETIIERIDASDESTDEYLTYISEIIGIPATDLTQEDIDFVVGLIGEDEAITELNNDNRLYDVNFDGLINDIDIGLLQGFVDAGVDGVGEIPATGLYADAAQRQLELTGFISDQDDITRGLISDEAKATRGLMGATTLFNAMLGAGDISGTRVDVSTPDPARINYIYDFEDVFATPQQKSLFPSPYGKPQMAQQQQMAQRQSSTSGPLQIGGMAQGGKVDYDFTDEIMQIMRYGDN
jgi:hypothetical protein